jgi:hypothetical protein
MVESGRKHGPFDLRSPGRRKIATPSWELELDRDGPGTLDWSSFLARFFPTRQRHDSEALAAYAAYRNALDRAASGRSAALRPSHARSTPRARHVLATTAAEVNVKNAGAPALANWESEGGSVDRDLAGAA